MSEVLPKLHIIVRGFLYRENWTPLSKRRHKINNYTINFFNQISDSFHDLINKLSDKYSVNLYFSTYDTTPQDILKRIEQEFKPKQIFLSPEVGSSQFTTVKTALEIFTDYEPNDLILVIRGDILIKQPLIDLIHSFRFTRNVLYVLCREKPDGTRFTRNIVIDVFQIFRGLKVKQYYDYISIPGLWHAHKIHKSIFSIGMLNLKDSELCPTTYLCSHYFEIQNNNSNWWT